MKLSIEIKGIEIVSVENEGYTDTFNGKKREIFKNNYDIASFDNRIVGAGSHYFPFSLKLPKDLQPSFFFSAIYFGCVIRY
jgi:hypothetical protein